MARRLKFKDVCREIQMEHEQHPSLRNNAADSQLQNLFLHPEAKRLYVLNNEMNQLVQDGGLTIDDKVRRFEEKLSEFIKLKESLIRHGSFLDMNNFSQALDEKIEQKVEEAIKKTLSQPDADQDSHPSDTMKTSTTPTIIMNNTEIPAGLSTTPQQGEGDLQPLQGIYEVLSQHGIGTSTTNKSKIEVSVPESTTKSTYSKKTLDDIVKYFLDPSPRHEDIPRMQWKNLMSYVYHALKNESDFGNMLNNYPNLNRYHLQMSFPIQNWESIK